MQVRLFFRLSLPHWDKWVDVSRGKIAQTHKKCWTLGRGGKKWIQQPQQAHAKGVCPSATARTPTECLGFTWLKHDLRHQDLMQSADVIPAWQKHQNCTILQGKEAVREEKSEHITPCRERQLLALIHGGHLRPHWPSQQQATKGLF